LCLNKHIADIVPQPEDSACGPAVLHFVYQCHSVNAGSITQMIAQIQRPRWLGSYAPELGCHALRRGMDARIYATDTRIFDPTWFAEPRADLKQKLRDQQVFFRKRSDAEHRAVSTKFLRFLKLGGKVDFSRITPGLIAHLIKEYGPLIADIDSTYFGDEMRYYTSRSGRLIQHDLRGGPVGHFVALVGANLKTMEITVADPQNQNPFSDSRIYCADFQHLINALMLERGNLLCIRPR
jgi:hypothetical protein